MNFLLQNMHPNPDKRHSIETTIDESKKILFQNDTLQDLVLLLNSSDLNTDVIINTINKDIDDINMIIKEASLRLKQ